jgi:hypothetical protein
MEIKNKLVLVLGGWGLVGSAICRQIMKHDPKGLIVASLSENEAVEAVTNLRREFPERYPEFFIPWWGNLFVRHGLKDMKRDLLMQNSELKKIIYHDIFDELSDDIFKNSSLQVLISTYKPDIIIDCINTATGIAYQNIYHSATDVIEFLDMARSNNDIDGLISKVEGLLCSTYIPPLIRHIQILYRSMHECSTGIYVKIGTSGTGGMGLNIPYTHSEEKPSRVLLSKSAVAGAHTLLLFLMGRTPDAPITKEIKPTAAIAWKKIGYGEILKQGKPIELFDCDIDKAVDLSSDIFDFSSDPSHRTEETLKSIFIDTGENGLFSRGEFETISSSGQMEYVTPEEIAEDAIYEIQGGNTGRDIINALDNATLGPTYRAGYLHERAIKKLDDLEKKHNISSVAFEMLGPPRLSKLLYEAHILKLLYADVKTPLSLDADKISEDALNLLKTDKKLRTEIISIGIPILLPDGKKMLRTKLMKVPPVQQDKKLKISSTHIDKWAKDGWIDLRPENMDRWKKRFSLIIEQTSKIHPDDTSSRFVRNLDFWDHFDTIDEGKIVGWIFINEEKGERMKA